MSNERRRYVRKRVDLAGSFQAGDAAAQPVHITDMCPGGAFLDVETLPPFGTRIALTIELPKQTVVVDATVRWAKGSGIGVQFGLLGARDTYALTEHLADLEPIPDSLRG